MPHLLKFIGETPVADIAPIGGWQLYRFDEFDGDGFKTAGYTAQRGDEEVRLNVSRFRFTPSQARFAWLVENGFPHSPNFGPWDDTDIEMRMSIPAVPA
jgi:hypothetical protein